MDDPAFPLPATFTSPEPYLVSDKQEPWSTDLSSFVL